MSRTRPPQSRPTTSTPAAPASPALTWLDPGGPFLLPLVALLLTRAWLAVQIPFASEDAYITLRYARNFAAGLGAVYNPGERVYGYSSAPWMAWLALGIRVGMDPVLWSRLSLVLADVVTLLAAGSLLARHASRASAWCFCAMFALWPFCAALTTTGLEMSAFVALIALSAWLVDRKHPAAGAALGLLAVIRPEGIAAAAVIAVWASRRDRLVALAIASVVFGGLAAFYGSPIPQSVLAKASTYGAPGPLQSAQWWDWALPWPMTGDLAMTSEGKALALFSIVGAPAAVAGAVALWNGRTSVLTGAALSALVVWIAYILTGASYFYWYMATPVFAWMALVAAGLPRITTGRWLYLAGALALLGSWIIRPQLYITRTLSENGLFAGAGGYVANAAKPGETILLEPLGTIGWVASGQRLIDEVGLVSPAISARRAQGAGWYTDVLARERPQWLVVRAGLLTRGDAFAGPAAPFRSLAEKESALSAYETVASGDQVAGDQNLVILHRRDTK